MTAQAIGRVRGGGQLLCGWVAAPRAFCSMASFWRRTSCLASSPSAAASSLLASASAAAPVPLVPIEPRAKLPPEQRATCTCTRGRLERGRER